MICNLHLSVVARTIVRADPSLIYTSTFLGHKTTTTTNNNNSSSSCSNNHNSSISNNNVGFSHSPTDTTTTAAATTTTAAAATTTTTTTTTTITTTTTQGSATHLLTLDLVGAVDGGHVHEVFEDGGVGRDADTCPHQHRHLVLVPVLLPSAVRSVQVQLHGEEDR